MSTNNCSTCLTCSGWYKECCLWKAAKTPRHDKNCPLLSLLWQRTQPWLPSPASLLQQVILGKPTFSFPKNLGIQTLHWLFFPLYITTAIFFVGSSWVCTRVKVQCLTLKAEVLIYLRGSGLPVLYFLLGTGSSEGVKIPGANTAVVADAQLQTLNIFGQWILWWIW